jgi:prepilin-type N-terminal cleavage/methylation domain-containing protein
MSRIAIKRLVGSGQWAVGRRYDHSPLTIHHSLAKGFTLLELLVALAILAIVITVARSPDLDMSNAKTSFQNTTQTLKSSLSTLRNQALSMGTTTRMAIAANNGVYTITTFSSPAPVNNCTNAGAWTQLSSNVINVHGLYQITGAAMANTCFYRDGTSSGGVFTIAPILLGITPQAQSNAENTQLKQAVITVTIATGYLDVATSHLTPGGNFVADPQ